MRTISLEREVLSPGADGPPPSQPARGRRGKRIAMSLIDMGLGDRIMVEAPLRLHRENRPNDYFIAIVDRNATVDFPHTLRQRFDEVWWISAGDGQRWKPSPRSAVARRVRDALVAARVKHVYVPAWLPNQFPRNCVYTVHPYNCICESDYLRDLGFYPRVVLPAVDRRWARQYLRATIPDEYEALISIHVRNYWILPEKNLDPRLIEQILSCLRARRRFAFLLVGRDDGPANISGPDVFSLVGRKWPFERMAAIIARTRLFIGADSGPTHAAAGLGVPIISFGCYGRHVRPFTDPKKYVYFQKGNSPQTIMAGVRAFVERLDGSFGRERGSWRTKRRRRRRRSC